MALSGNRIGGIPLEPVMNSLLANTVNAIWNWQGTPFVLVGGVVVVFGYDMLKWQGIIPSSPKSSLKRPNYKVARRGKTPPSEQSPQ